MPHGIKSDRTIMELQVIESLNTKILKISSYLCYRVYNQPNQNHMQGIESEHEYKGGRLRWVVMKIHREGGIGQFYPQCVVRWGVENFTE